MSLAFDSKFHPAVLPSMLAAEGSTSHRPWRLTPALARDVVVEKGSWVGHRAKSFGIVVHHHTTPEPDKGVQVERSSAPGTCIDFSMTTLRLVREGTRATNLSDRLSTVPVRTIDTRPLRADVLSRYLDEQFRFVLAGVADVYAAYDVRTRAISDAGGFTDELDEVLQRRVPIRPKSFEAFSNSLHTDVTRSLRRNGPLKRPWGDLEATPAGLVMRVNETPPLVVEFGERAEILE